MKSITQNQAAQRVQDAIFKKMSSDEKLDVAGGLWRLGRELSQGKEYGENRSAGTPRGSHGNTRQT